MPLHQKSSFDGVYGMHFNGCRSIYFGQKNRLVATRISEHQKKSQVDQLLVERIGPIIDIEKKTQYSRVEKQ